MDNGNPKVNNINEDIEEVVENVLMPRKITKRLIIRTIRRAKRFGIYWRLDPLERALLEVSALLKIDEFRGKKVREALGRVIAKVEMNTMKGLVLKAGLSYALSRGLLKFKDKFGSLLNFILSKLDYIKYLGRSILAVYNYYLRPIT